MTGWSLLNMCMMLSYIGGKSNKQYMA